MIWLIYTTAGNGGRTEDRVQLLEPVTSSAVAKLALALAQREGADSFRLESDAGELPLTTEELAAAIEEQRRLDRGT